MTATILALVGLAVGALLVRAAVKCRPAPSPGRALNTLGVLRTRLGYSTEHVAKVLGISPRAVGRLEAIPLQAWRVSDVERYVGALECRLDVVAVHIDGVAVWLSDEEPRS